MLQRQKRQKSTSFIVKTPVKSMQNTEKYENYHEKMNIEEVEETKKYENLQTKPVLDPFKSTADTRKVRELPRKMNIEEVEEPETTKIYRQNPRASARPPRKLRKFTDETNMQARNHENSDEFCTEPRPPPRSSHPGFYYYRKNPKCYHTVWGKSNLSSFSTKAPMADHFISLLRPQRSTKKRPGIMAKMLTTPGGSQSFKKWMKKTDWFGGGLKPLKNVKIKLDNFPK